MTKEFEPTKLSAPSILELSGRSLLRTTSFAQMILETPTDQELLERFRAERRIYLDYSHRFIEAVREGRVR